MTHLLFSHRPSDLDLLLTVLRNSSPRRRVPEAALGLRASWHDIRLKREYLEAFHASCGLDLQDGISILYPMTLTYPLIQHMLSHSAAPMPLYRMLNTRMVMQQHRPLVPTDRPSVDVGVTGVRRISKGVELDVHVHMHVEDGLVWECSMTFLYRGRVTGAVHPAAPEPDLRVVQPEQSLSWYLPAAGALRFRKISGDNNPIHFGKLYAKAFGFERDFAQPLLVLGQAMSRLPALPAHQPQRLEARLKGPVYYERTLKMLVQPTASGPAFDVYCEPNPRPSICARLELLT